MPITNKFTPNNGVVRYGSGNGALKSSKLYAPSGGGSGDGVTQIIAGDNVYITPTNGMGSVTIGANILPTNDPTYFGMYIYSTGAGANNFTAGGNRNIKIGSNAGIVNQQSGAIAIGINAGRTSQGTNAIAIGYNAGSRFQQQGAIALGSAGFDYQGTNAIAIGYLSAHATQGENAIAIGGQYCGHLPQGKNAIAIGGEYTGFISQQNNAIAIGVYAGHSNQGTNAIAIGYYAGATDQGAHSICITTIDPGAPVGAESVYINASGTAVTPLAGSGILIAGVEDAPVGGLPSLCYEPSTGKVVADTAKLFIIDHPLDSNNKYLIHSCLEGPENGVYYRGTNELNGSNGNLFCKTITLPEYTNKFYNFTIDVSAINGFNNIYTSRVKFNENINQNEFTVYGSQKTKFDWCVYAEREEGLFVEPYKSQIVMEGDGPYKYISGIVV